MYSRTRVGCDFRIAAGIGARNFLMGNMGLNYRYSASPDAPLELNTLDMDKNDSLVFWIGYHQQGK